MEKDKYTGSHLFTLRVWKEKGEDDEVSYRGKLHHIPSDKIRYFRGWASLIPLILDMLRSNSQKQPNEPDEDQIIDSQG